MVYRTFVFRRQYVAIKDFHRVAEQLCDCGEAFMALKIYRDAKQHMKETNYHNGDLDAFAAEMDIAAMFSMIRSRLPPIAQWNDIQRQNWLSLFTSINNNEPQQLAEIRPKTWKTVPYATLRSLWHATFQVEYVEFPKHFFYNDYEWLIRI